MKAVTKNTPGQKLFVSLLRSDAYDRTANTLDASKRVGEVTKRWMTGMSRSLREKFAVGLKKRRIELNLTQEGLADIAGLTSTAVAMIERKERYPNLDTATRLCWALDVAAGVTLEDL